MNIRNLFKIIVLLFVMVILSGQLAFAVCLMETNHSCCNSGNNQCQMSSAQQSLTNAESINGKIFIPNLTSLYPQEPKTPQTLQIANFEDVKLPPGFLEAKISHPSIAPPLA